MLWSFSFKCHVNNSTALCYVWKQPAGASFSQLFFFPWSFTQMFPRKFMFYTLLLCVHACVCVLCVCVCVCAHVCA